MDGKMYRRTIEQLDMTPSEAADFFGVNETSERRWANGTHAIPRAVTMLLSVMMRYNLTNNSVAALMTKYEEAA